MRLFLFAFFLASTVFAQAPVSPTATVAAPRAVRLHFVPPPFEGTISLGIFDATGKLVRVLHREDAISDFTLGHDALETTWDGNDDHGKTLPPGRYHARGYLVGELKIEGVEYFFNDWVTDANSPHLARITRVAIEDGKLKLSAITPGNKAVSALYDFVSGKLKASEPNESVVVPQEIERLPLPQGTLNPTASAPGRNGTIWRIVRLEDGAVEVEQTAANVDLRNAPILRKLSILPNEPRPIAVAASLTEERIFLLEETPDGQRVRSLTLIATKPDGADRTQTISDWKVDFEKKITGHENFVLVQGKPALAPGAAPAAPEKLTRTLRRNPLQRDEPGKIDLAVGVDADGSYLQTADGLPLRTVSDTPNLSRALLARKDAETVDLFEDDGAVVEQYRISQLDQMMAFDCGEFELKAE